MPKETKRGVGRPIKKPKRGKRISLGLKVTADTKRRIDLAARASGRTQSQEAEHRIELSYALERALDNFNSKQTLEKLADDLASRLSDNLTLRAAGRLEPSEAPQGPGKDPKFSALVPDVKALSKSVETKSKHKASQQELEKGGRS